MIQAEKKSTHRNAPVPIAYVQSIQCTQGLFSVHQLLLPSRLSPVPSIQAFEQVFGADSVSKENVTKAIAAYERTLITPNSAYDKYIKGNKKALTAQQISGMNKLSELGCAGCHSGPAFNGPGSFQKFPVNSNSVFRAKYGFEKDKGLAEVTGNSADQGMWKVPTLRNIAMTAPYFHNGAVRTLDQAVNVMAKLQLDKDLSKQERADIVAFLNALTGEFPKQQMSKLPGTPGTAFK